VQRIPTLGSRATKRASMFALYGVSFVLHASLGAGMAEIEPEKESEHIAISMVEPPKPKSKEEPPPPPPPPPPIESKRKAARPKAAEAPPPPSQPTPAPAAADAPTFGIAMSGGVGLGGVAVPLGDSLHGSKEPVKRVTQAKNLAAPKAEEASAAEVVEVKPKLLSAPPPEYPESARASGIEGKVRLQLSISAEGKVVDVKVLESLGHGLDEAAVAVARTYEFTPATRDGQPVATTITIGIRFSL
jgi:protein TonB